MSWGLAGARVGTGRPTLAATGARTGERVCSTLPG